jgi:hypothetical protein
VGSLFHGIVSLVNLMLDYPLLSGKSGLLPDSPWNEGIALEFNPLVVLKYFPSLLYFFDGMLLIYMGLLIAIVGTVGCFWKIEVGRVSALFVYLVLLSFSHSRGVLMWFPWDCLLYETLLIAAFAPDSSFAKRFLLFRVMFGFGKHKFFGADSLEDLTYTQSMACWQPLGSSIGWYLTFLPSMFHVISIVFTFTAEMIAPFIILFYDRFSPLAFRFSCWSIILLMASIQLTGHFGWFNILTAFITSSIMTVPSEPPKRVSLIRSSTRMLYITLGIVFLIPSQWNSPALFYQHTFDSPRFDLLRIVSSWRILHSYGVFPPKKMPMIKPVGQFQVTFENDTTLDLEYHYQSSLSRDPTANWPFLVAPFRFPRFDYVYGFYSASHVLSLTTRLGPMVGDGEEYIDSVARMLLSNPINAEKYFSNFNHQGGEIKRVKFFILGLVPNISGKWDLESKVLDKQWGSPPPLPSGPIADLFSLNMVVVRKQSILFGTDGHGVASPHRVLDRAIAKVEAENNHLFEREWMKKIETEFELISGQALFSFGNRSGLYDLDHASQFGGYIGCLTFAHLVPYPLHSPICPVVLKHNHRMRPETAYSKIPIPPYVYKILGLTSEDFS